MAVVIRPLHVTGTLGRSSAHIVVRGELDLASVGEVAQAVLAARSDGCKRLTLDLDEVTFLDCTALTALVTARRLFDTEGRRFTITAASRPVLRLMSLTGTHWLLSGALWPVRSGQAPTGRTRGDAAGEDRRGPRRLA